MLSTDASFQHANKEIPFPSWTAFNILISKGGDLNKTSDRYGYLPIIDAPITDINVVKFILDKSLRIADTLKLQEIVIVVDQNVYAKIQEIRYKQKGVL